ncbi:MAG: GGDEF domain-containing protein [Clostridia bacterium]|nr:GGDEF domain-containing protein [Clostridia bacterium]
MVKQSTGKQNITLGIILGHFEETCQSLILPGIIDYAEKNNINLIIFNGATMEELCSYNDNFNIISRFINKENIDGLIMLSGVMANLIQRKEVENLCNLFLPLPVVSIAMSLDGVPSILIDNTSGICEIVSHLIEVHQFKRLAFVCGPAGHEEADARFTAYKEALMKHGIDFSENLIAPGNFSNYSGKEAVRLLIDERKERVDAFISVDDHTAHGVVTALNARGIRVPEDIAVTGFDDSREAKSCLPPLTTVHQPFYEMGKKAIETVLSKLAVLDVPMKTFLPTKMVVRESCGCFSNTLAKVHKLNELNGLPLWSGEKNHLDIDEVVDKVLKELEEYSLDRAEIEVLIQNFFVFLSNSPDDFKGEKGLLMSLRTLLRTYASKGHNILLWHNALSIIRNWFMQNYCSAENFYLLEYILHKARLLISEVSWSLHEFNQSRTDFKHWLLRQVSQKLIISFDFNSLLNVIEDGLKNLEIKGCLIVLYTYEKCNTTFEFTSGSLPKYSNLVFAYNNYGRIHLPPGGFSFSTKDMIPTLHGLDLEMSKILFMPLFFNQEQFGYILFEYAALEKSIYETLRCHISSAIKGSLLYSERKQVENTLKITLQKLEHLNHELKNISIIDELTLLNNRRGFFEAANAYYRHAYAGGHTFILFFIDLDNLKHINDTFGHKEGDNSILFASDILKQTFRKTDIIARLGGDEFTVLVADTPMEDIYNIKRRLQNNIDNFNLKSEKPYHLSMSVGLSIYTPDCKHSLEELMSLADKNLYEDKARKKALHL